MPVYKEKQRGTYYVSCYSKITHKKKRKEALRQRKLLLRGKMIL